MTFIYTYITEKKTDNKDIVKGGSNAYIDDNNESHKL